MVNPLPTIALAGQFLQCFPVTGPDGRPVLAHDRPTLTGEMAIQWGRADVWTQPEPSVVTLTLWEQDSTWLKRLVSQTAVRQPIRITYPRVGGPHPGDRPIFQGFTTNVDVVAENGRTAAGTVPGWRVQIQAADRSGFIGQEMWGPIQLPEQTMQERAVRIRNQAGPVGIRQFYFEEGFRNGQVVARDVDRETVLDTMNGMYQSFADQWCYNPERNTVNRIPGGSNWSPYALRFGTSPAVDRGVRLYPPTWEDPSGKEDPIDTRGYDPGYIGGCDVAGPIALSSSLLQDITAITCHWYDKPNGKDWSTEIIVKQSVPRARLEFDSWYNDGRNIDPILVDVQRTVTTDGARPVHPTLVWDCARSRDVPDWPSFDALASPCQTVRMICLSASPFTEGLGLPPVWHACGGEIAYGAGKWRFTVNLSPTTMTLPAGFRAATFADIPDFVKLGPTDDPDDYYLDGSVTSYSIGFVDGRYASVYDIS